MDNELNKCGCHDGENGCGCGTGDHGCGCNHDHDHDHDGCGCEEHETFVIDLEDDNGNVISCPIVDAFQCEEKEYILAMNEADDSYYLFRVEGEEGEDLVVPDEEEFDRVSKYYNDVLVNEE